MIIKMEERFDHWIEHNHAILVRGKKKYEYNVDIGNCLATSSIFEYVDILSVK